MEGVYNFSERTTISFNKHNFSIFQLMEYPSENKTTVYDGIPSLNSSTLKKAHRSLESLTNILFFPHTDQDAD